MKTGIRNNNKGITLVELIIVLAIMAILVGGFFTSTKVITNARSKKLTESIYTAMGNVKTNSLAAARPGDTSTESVLKLWQNGKGVYMTVILAGKETEKARKIAPAGIDVKYVDKSGTSHTSLPSTEANAVTVKFRRGSGVVDTTSDYFTSFSSGPYEVILVDKTGKMKWGRK